MLIRIKAFLLCAGLFLSAAPGCSCDENTQSDGYDVPEADTQDTFDMTDTLDGLDGPDFGDHECPEAHRCGASCCDEDERCLGGATCIPDNGTCLDDDECINDTYCEDGVCVPYGAGDRGEFNPECRREAEPLDSFEPVVQCEWPIPEEPDLEEPDSLNVQSPPLIGDLDEYGQGTPEIVFATWSESARSGPVRAILGDDCSTVWTSTVHVPLAQDLAIADLDSDGFMEVCSRSVEDVAFCLDHAGNEIWRGHDGAGADVVIEEGLTQVGVAIADTDGVPPPEVIVGLSVFDASTGLLKLRGPDVGATNSTDGIIPAIADLDGDGHLEAATGGIVFDLVDGDVVDWDPPYSFSPHGFTAVGELDSAHDGPEVIVVQPEDGVIRIHASTDGAIIWSTNVDGGKAGSPAIADLDGDGRAEFAVVGSFDLTAYDLDCTVDSPDPALCSDPDDSDGIIWEREIQDRSSGVTGLSVFDFEGDGPVEVVYADECWIRVFDGRTGEVKFSAPHLSGTSFEYPTIGDVDGDFYTEIVVPNHDSAVVSCPDEDPISPGTLRDPGRRYNGVTVYRDITDRWAPSRPLWTQHAEHYSQRNDDGTVPSPEPHSWLDHNSYRQALPMSGTTMLDEPDLTVRDITAPECDLDEAVQPLGATVCNRGTLPVAAGVMVTFRMDTSDGEAICTAATEEILHPGECTDVGCDWIDVPLDEPHDVWAVVDDNGEGEGAINECLEGNNLAFIEAVRCPPTIV